MRLICQSPSSWPAVNLSFLSARSCPLPHAHTHPPLHADADNLQALRTRRNALAAAGRRVVQLLAARRAGSCLAAWSGWAALRARRHGAARALAGVGLRWALAAVWWARWSDATTAAVEERTALARARVLQAAGLRWVGGVGWVGGASRQGALVGSEVQVGRPKACIEVVFRHELYPAALL
jgi:hypothetical protein